MKRCSNPACERAGQLLPLEDFSLDRRCAQGRRARCKRCCAARDAARKAAGQGVQCGARRICRERWLPQRAASTQGHREKVRRNPRKRKAFVEDVDLEELFEVNRVLGQDHALRDWCGKPLYRHQMEVDLIVSLATSGKHDRENLQPIHGAEDGGCNQQKNHRWIRPGQAGPDSTTWARRAG